MENTQPPIRIICPGRVYRNELSAIVHMHFLPPVEALFIDRNVSFTDLKQALLLFAQEMFGKGYQDTPSSFLLPVYGTKAPKWTSAVISVAAKAVPFCKKGTGWVEILGGCGMVDPNVLELNGIDSKIYSGYAF